jgi:hypothetical protein
VTTEPQFRSEGTVQAELTGNRGIRASREILVLPDGTFRVVGTVTEADVTNIPIHGARVEVAVDEGFSALAAFATSGPDGRYKLYGVPGDGYFRVRREGYVTRTDRIQIANHETRNVQLGLESERPSRAGEYRMTIEAACGSGTGLGPQPLPNDLRHRQYDAVITQNGPQLTFTLTGAPFYISGDQGNRFTGVVTTTGATFKMRGFYASSSLDWHPDVVERLPDGTLLVIMGDVTVVTTSDGLAGSGGLFLTRWPDPPGIPEENFLNYCGTQRVTFERR